MSSDTTTDTTTDTTSGTDTDAVDPDAHIVPAEPDGDPGDAAYPPSPPIHEGGHGHKEPTDRQYVMIAVILAVLTAIEIAATELGNDGPWLVPSLIVLMTIKFFVVVLFFMHLRFDSRLFSLMFYIGLSFAVVLYTVVLATFHFFTG
jgi:caa(3)-type oxidase subunit IV